MSKKQNVAVLSLILASLVIFLIIILVSRASRSGPYDAFASCLKDNGAVFYGAFWCPHCQDQKDMFKTAAKYLPYVECSTPDGRNQLATCTDKGIAGYPTWTFADGSRVEGTVPMEELASRSGCTLQK